jgi:uncharacterized protein YceH (UPF0502 family)
VDVDAVEIRILGCLIEKQRTTPDAYPLSLNALRLACNQATNRDPVVAYEEREIKAGLDRMSNRGWTRLASGVSSRALKYRQLLDEALGLSEPEISLLGVLMLRGPQTVGELKQRSERLHHFDSIAEVVETLDGLAQRELVARLERRAGQKEERWEQLLGGGSEATAESIAEVPNEDPDRFGAIEQRLERLETAFHELIARVDKVPDRE